MRAKEKIHLARVARAEALRSEIEGKRARIAVLREQVAEAVEDREGLTHWPRFESACKWSRRRRRARRWSNERRHFRRRERSGMTQSAGGVANSTP